MTKYMAMNMTEYKVMKMVDNIHEIIDYIDDGYHNAEIGQLVQISNALLEDLDKEKNRAQA